MTKPVLYLNWAPSGTTNGYVQQPSAGQQNTGWVGGQAPPYQTLNWITSLTDQWIQYLDSVTSNANLLAGFTRAVNNGTGSYAKLSLALVGVVAGDNIIVYGSTTETADVVIPAGVGVMMMPGALITMSGAGIVNGLTLNGANARALNMRLMLNATSASAVSMVFMNGNDTHFDGHLIENQGTNLANVVQIANTALRARVESSVNLSSGTYTNLASQATNAGFVNIWGG